MIIKRARKEATCHDGEWGKPASLTKSALQLYFQCLLLEVIVMINSLEGSYLLVANLNSGSGNIIIQ